MQENVSLWNLAIIRIESNARCGASNNVYPFHNVLPWDFIQEYNENKVGENSVKWQEIISADYELREGRCYGVDTRRSAKLISVNSAQQYEIVHHCQLWHDLS